MLNGWAGGRYGFITSLLSHLEACWEASCDTGDKFSASFPFVSFVSSVFSNCSECLPQEKEVVLFP